MDASNKIHWSEHKVRLEQKICNSVGILDDFNAILASIAKLAADNHWSKGICFLSYAWPHDQCLHEAWIQPFIENLNQHLNKAGITTSLDRKNNRIGGSVYGFIEQLEQARDVIIIGSLSLLIKHKIGKSNICSELNIIREKPSAHVFPVLLSGEVSRAYPQWFIGYTNIVDWRTTSYLQNLKDLIAALYQIVPDHKLYQLAWAEFENKYPELWPGLSQETVDALLQAEAASKGAERKKAREFFHTQLDRLACGNSIGLMHGGSDQTIKLETVNRNLAHHHRQRFKIKASWVTMTVIVALCLWGVRFGIMDGPNAYVQQFLAFVNGIVLDRPQISIIDNNGIIPNIHHPIPRVQTALLYEQSKLCGEGLCILSIHGLPGMGKTVLASLFADLHFNHQPKHHKLRWFIRSEKESTRNEDYTNLAKSLGVISHAQSSLPDVIVKVNKKLQQFPEFILIFDNVVDFDSIAELIPNDPNLKGEIIITSQKSNLIPVEYRGQSFTVSINEGMTENESLELLQTLTGKPPGESGKLLSRQLGYAPLALVQAAALMAKRKMSLQEYVSLYNTNHQVLYIDTPLPRQYADEKIQSDPALFAKRTYGHVLGLTFDQLTPNALEILQLAAYLSPDHIPVRLFQTLPLSSDRFKQILSELEDASLITLSAQQEHFSIHRVIQNLIRVNIREKILIENLEVLCMHRLLAMLHRELESGIVTEHDYIRKRALLPHFENILGEFKEGKRPLTLPIILGMVDMGILFKSIGKAKLAIEYYQLALQHLPQNEIAMLRQVYQALGRAYQGTGNFDLALMNYEKALQTGKEQDQQDNKIQASLLNDLGMTLRDLGVEAQSKEKDKNLSQKYFLEAVQYLNRAVEMSKNSPNQHKNRIRYLTNLGEVYRLLGHFDEAKTTILEAIQMSQVEFPDQRHRLVSSAYFTLGNLFMSKKDFTSAQLHFRKAVAISLDEEVAGKLHPLTARHMNALGLSLQNLNNREQACKYFKEAQAILLNSGLGQAQLVQQVDDNAKNCSEQESIH